MEPVHLNEVYPRQYLDLKVQKEIKLKPKKYSMYRNGVILNCTASIVQNFGSLSGYCN